MGENLSYFWHWIHCPNRVAETMAIGGGWSNEARIGIWHLNLLPSANGAASYQPRAREQRDQRPR
jgi:hypothetical protein